MTEAYHLLRTFPKRFGFKSSAAVGTAYIAACLLNQQPSLALQEFERMRQEGPQPDQYTLRRVLALVVTIQVSRDYTF